MIMTAIAIAIVDSGERVRAELLGVCAGVGEGDEEGEGEGDEVGLREGETDGEGEVVEIGCVG
jgi:hypothetical protein